MERATGGYKETITKELAKGWRIEDKQKEWEVERDYYNHSVMRRRTPFLVERDEMFRTLKMIRREIREKADSGETEEAEELKGVLSEFRVGMRDMRAKMDVLNEQFEKNRTLIEVESEETGRHVLPVIRLCLKEKRNRVPYVMIGGVAAAADQAEMLSASLALSGKDVYIIGYPEHRSAQATKDWGERLAADKSLRLHGKLMSEAIRKLGFMKVNLLGNSMGGGIALEVALSREVLINDLILLEPMGFFDKSLAEIGWNYYVQQGLSVYLEAERRIKVLWSFGPRGDSGITKGMFGLLVEILRRRHFDEERLSQLRVGGRLCVWLGESSPLLNASKVAEVFLNTEGARRALGQKAMELTMVEGGDHTFPLLQAPGLVKNLDMKMAGVRLIESRELERSMAEVELRRILANRE